MATKTSKVVVDLGTTKKATIRRNGVKLPAVEVNTSVLEGILRGGIEVELTVARQSIPAGTTVPKGATVDLMLARTKEFPIGVIVGAHRALAEVPIAHVSKKVLENNEVLTLISEHNSTKTMTVAERERLVKFMAGVNAPVDEREGHDLEAGFKAVKGVFALAGQNG